MAIFAPGRAFRRLLEVREGFARRVSQTKKRPVGMKGVGKLARERNGGC